MKSVVQHGSTAEASFTATVNLAQQGRVWNYRGHFGLRRVGGDWKVVWAPSVINPNLGPGERLAVVTTFPDRAAVLDDKGDPLQLKAPAYVLGVTPDRLASPATTAQAFAKHTGLQAGQVLGQITAAPPHSFLRLATLDSASYARLRPSLRSVPGLMVRPEAQRVFQAGPPAWSAGWAARSTSGCAPTARYTPRAPRWAFPGSSRNISASCSARRRPR